MNRILRIVFVGFRTIRLHFVNSVQKISHARKNAWLSSDLPSAALPASGSRGSSTTSQPFGSPALSREATARGAEVNASKHGAWNCEIGVGEKDLVAPRSLL